MRRMMLFGVVAVTAVIALPVVGSSQTPGIHGGTPSDVFMNTEDVGGVCPKDKVKTEPVGLMPTKVVVGEDSSHILAFFSATWNGFDPETELVVWFEIQGEGDFFARSPEWILPDSLGGQFNANHNGGTLMWSFANVPAGDYTVQAVGALAAFEGAVHGSDGVSFQGCALTTFVIPAA
jgi:hypothetical protein